MRRAVGVALLALLVASAGCLGATGPGTATAGDASDGGDASADATAVDGPAGTVDFYVSDRPNDMDDFEHLNVTITSVRFHRTGDAANATTAAGNGTVENATVTAESTDTTAAATATETATGTETAEVDEADDADEADDERGDGQWVEREVNATTVDLTRLRGDNATLVERFALPAGEYDQVVLDVSEVNGTLEGGESTEVKLPSERLKLDSEFTVADGSETSFVYDISVHEAGNSGKYILRPVIEESGADQPVRRVDDREDSLNASLLGTVEPGENVTVRVTDDGEPVADATVSVEGGPGGTTDADGEYVFTVPADAEELEIEVEAGDAEAELEREFEDDDAESAASDDEAADADEETAESGG
jgi:hypothetical protein